MAGRRRARSDHPATGHRRAIVASGYRDGLRRSRLYELIEQYRSAPVTSSLAAATPGPKPGSRRLSAETEALIQEAIRETYLTRQKASVSKVHDHLWHLCRARGLATPVLEGRSRPCRTDRSLQARQHARGRKTARDGLKPVTQEYRADHALYVVQINHTLRRCRRRRG